MATRKLEAVGEVRAPMVEESADLKHELREARAALERQESLTREFELQLIQAHSEMQMLKTKHQAVQKQMQMHNFEVEQRLSAANEQIGELERKASATRDLKEQLKQAQSNMHALKSKHQAEQMEQKAEIEQMKQQNEALQTDRENLSGLLSTADEQIRKVKGSVESLQGKIQSAKNQALSATTAAKSASEAAKLASEAAQLAQLANAAAEKAESAVNEVATEAGAVSEQAEAIQFQI